MSNIKPIMTNGQFERYLKVVQEEVIKNGRYLHIITPHNAFTLFRGEDSLLHVMYVRFNGEDVINNEVKVKELTELAIFEIFYNNPMFNYICDEYTYTTPVNNLISNLSNYQVPFGAAEIFTLIRYINKHSIFSINRINNIIEENQEVIYNKVYSDLLFQCDSSKLHIDVDAMRETVKVNLEYVRTTPGHRFGVVLEESNAREFNIQNVNFISQLFVYLYGYVLSVEDHFKGEANAN